MIEFLQDYWFFVLVTVLMMGCHLFHSGHGGHDEQKTDKNGDGL